MILFFECLICLNFYFEKQYKLRLDAAEVNLRSFCQDWINVEIGEGMEQILNEFKEKWTKISDMKIKSRYGIWLEE